MTIRDRVLFCTSSARTRPYSKQHSGRTLSRPRRRVAPRAQRAPAPCGRPDRLTREGMVAMSGGPRPRVAGPGQVAHRPRRAGVSVLLRTSGIGDQFTRDRRARVGRRMGHGAKRGAGAGRRRGRFDAQVRVAMFGRALVERTGSDACHRGSWLPVLRWAAGVEHEQPRRPMSAGRRGVGYGEERSTLAERRRRRLAREVLVALRIGTFLGSERVEPRESRRWMSRVCARAPSWSAATSSKPSGRRSAARARHRRRRDGRHPRHGPCGFAGGVRRRELRGQGASWGEIDRGAGEEDVKSPRRGE